ncbi:MAG: HlyD family secretion protein [Saprospiraceae bacterium]|nr:HlyD family secretion protein [Saprospiraceae bacterium]
MHRFQEFRKAGRLSTEEYRSFTMLRQYQTGRTFAKLILISLGIFLVFLFLPWTQNIRANGFLTTLRPEHRPQTVHAIIAGRIDQWYVREGDHVQPGDTILHLSEIKDDYFDPKLLDRTRQQINAKTGAMDAYQEKIGSMNAQIDALSKSLDLKLQQSRNYIRQSELKVISDSTDLVAARANEAVADAQLNRMRQLHRDGLNSLTDLETRNLKYQEASAKAVSAENKLLASRNELLNARVELISIEQQYRDKLAKARAERAAALSEYYGADSEVAKMEGQYSNYEARAGFYFVTAAQEGMVTKAIRAGIGETVKAGEPLVSLMPVHYELAVEMYIEPVDLPLIQIGNKVRFLFDGWPAIVFSGWPNATYGAFGGEVFAIDNFISENGKYRVLVSPDPADHPWPKGLRVGSGAIGMALLKDVPIWYELWRQLNGFPPNFYQQNDQLPAQISSDQYKEMGRETPKKK